MPPSNSENDQAPPKRLSPEMSCFRALVLAFVTNYIDEWKISPSYGEIANALDSGRTRVKRAIKSLRQDGLILSAGGPRGLRLPSDREAAVKLLRELGHSVDENAKVVFGGTKQTLLPPAVLRYPANRAGSAGDKNANGQDRGGEA